MTARDSASSSARQEQFLEVISRDEAATRFQRYLKLEPVGHETVPLMQALGRVAASRVLSDVDVPGFDRSNVDGFAIRASDSYGASEEQPPTIRLTGEVIPTGVRPEQDVAEGRASVIATGAMLPRGADAVVMIEHTEVDREGRSIEITRAVSPGENVTFAGTDIALGQTILRTGEMISSREIGVLAAVGKSSVEVYRRPRVALISTGDEIVAPGEDRPPGFVYDSNLAILAGAVEELGGEPVPLGIVADSEAELEKRLETALECDLVVLSGGTSKGAGDLSYRAASRLNDPGIVAHGVALKPGKPICLAVTQGKAVVVLPGFPTSAIFTFHEFVAPVIQRLAGTAPEARDVVAAALPMRVNSERGRTEYLLVSLVRGSDGLAAYPMGKGSGSVTAYSHADGFITIPQQTEILETGSPVEVQLLSARLRPADLVIIGSHCVGVDRIIDRLTAEGLRVKALHVGSMGGIAAARRGECDLAGIHLMDAKTGEYNRTFLSPELDLIKGYRRLQGVVYRRGDERFEGKTAAEAMAGVATDPECTMINRNVGSGTRILIDQLLAGHRPPGYGIQAKLHNAVATAVAQGRADWGVAIDTVAKQYGLGFLPMQEEHYDFAMPRSRANREPALRFRELLQDESLRAELTAFGFHL